jgi:hypothetical protein
MCARQCPVIILLVAPLATVSQIFSGFRYANFLFFPGFAGNFFHFEDMYGREAETQDVHQRAPW